MVTTPKIFKINHRMMLILVPVVSLESPLNINTKISTNVPSVWLLWRHNDMRPHKNQEICIVSIVGNRGFCMGFLSRFASHYFPLQFCISVDIASWWLLNLVESQHDSSEWKRHDAQGNEVIPEKCEDIGFKLIAPSQRSPSSLKLLAP